MKGKLIWILLLLPALMGIASCSAKTPPHNTEGILALDAMMQDTVEFLDQQIPNLKSKIQNSKAYAVVDWKLTKIPLIGMGSGEGVLSVIDTGEKFYFDASRFDIGGGVGKNKYRALMVIESPEILEKVKDSTWIFLAGTDTAGVGSDENKITTIPGEGYTRYVIHKTGTLVAVTAKLIRIRIKR